MFKRCLFYSAVLCIALFLAACDLTDVYERNEYHTLEKALVGTWLNQTDTGYTCTIRLIDEATLLYDTTYTPYEVSAKWDTITFINDHQCFYPAYDDTADFRIEIWKDTLRLRISGYEIEDGVKYAGSGYHPFDSTLFKNDTLQIRPFTYKRISEGN